MKLQKRNEELELAEEELKKDNFKNNEKIDSLKSYITVLISELAKVLEENKRMKEDKSEVRILENESKFDEGKKVLEQQCLINRMKNTEESQTLIDSFLNERKANMDTDLEKDQKIEKLEKMLEEKQKRLTELKNTISKMANGLEKQMDNYTKNQRKIEELEELLQAKQNISSDVRNDISIKSSEYQQFEKEYNDIILKKDRKIKELELDMESMLNENKVLIESFSNKCGDTDLEKDIKIDELEKMLEEKNIHLTDLKINITKMDNDAKKTG